MYKIHRLDIMIAYSCNISCAGCISISDIKRSGIEPFDLLHDSIVKWSSVVVPTVVVVFGGEPCLHPRLPDICNEIRKAWPAATIRLITNGYLLDRFDSAAWFDFAPFEIQVSIHRKDHEPVINEKIKNILKNRKPWAITKQGGERQHQQLTWTHNDFSIFKSIFDIFVPPYKKISTNFLPFHGDPVKAHKICGAGSTPILYKGMLYKCPAVANIIDITGENWFNYQAIDIHDNIETFVANIGSPEPVCAQCPDSMHTSIDHFDQENVIVKHKNIS
jgi:hypothetical protein